MNELASQPQRRRFSPRSRKLALILRRTLYVKLALLVLVPVALGALYLRLSVSPLSFESLPERVASSLAERIGPGWAVDLRNAALQVEEGSVALRATGLDIRNPEGALVLRAPLAIVSLDNLSLLGASLQPRSIEFLDLQLRASLDRNGALTFLPGQEEGSAPEPVAPPAPDQPSGPASPVSVAVGSLLDLIVGPRGVIGSLEKARLTNARLSVIGTDSRERTTFTRVDASFDRTEAGGRHFDARLEGPRGAWELSGDARVEGSTFRATMEAANAPVLDLLLLAGASAVPATTDLKLSGRVDAAFSEGRVTELRAQLGSNAGQVQIDDPDTSPLAVEKLSLDLHWDEGRRALVVPMMDLKGGATRVRLQGELATQLGEPGYRAVFTGRDAVLRGAADADPPVKIDAIDARLTIHEGLTIDSLKLRGPALDAQLSGALAQASDPKGLKLDVKGAGTAVRHALRLWPEAVAPPVRGFLVQNLKGGTVDAIEVRVAMTGADIGKALNDEAIPEEALRVSFSITDGILAAADGLPPLTQTRATGLVTGTRVTIRVPSGRVVMADGRALAAGEGSFTLDNLWPDDAVARIDFRLNGGADALGSLLQTPLMKEIAGFELDPATTKGRADLRVAIGLPINDIPKFADLPLSITGAISDLTVDKLLGKDRFEGGNLAVSYERGTLGIKGEGKLSGAPATIDLQQSRDKGGEVNVAFNLDEAARARRGMTFGPQLTGIVGLKAALALGKNAKPGIRVEADLARAGIDNLIPGWVKPAGRPGKVSFVYVEGTTSEIRDLHLDSGPTQIRGSATLSSESGLEKAELATLKLSPGDDMRAQIERASGVYKVTVRGNLGDARPFTKLMASPSASARGAQAQKDTKDIDLDLALNILTGHNDEAITNASLKASLRKDTLRQLDLKGRLGSSNVMAQTVPRSNGNTVILAQAEDAGAALRFLDIYRRMAGGDLVLQMSTGEGTQSGFLTVLGFTLRNEPGLRRIIPTQSQMVAGRDKAGNPQNVRIDFNEVTFTRARIDFTRTAGRLDFKDAVIWGQQVGFTLSGYIDYFKDRTDITGTFVPAFGLNNAFAQVPLFGPILGGGQYEGLFAVNFRISGQATAPTLNVNPLSAVAPGFLRKLFGAGGGEPQAGAVPVPREPQGMNN